MSPSKVSQRIVLDRIVWAAESCLRRAIEALYDIGRHILARGFGQGDVEYRQIADALGATAVLDPAESLLMRTLAGYRNRLVHFYHEVSTGELFEICSRQLDDLVRVRGAYCRWMESHPGMIDPAF
jgi:uncharacterized protein YutE (UPF0331/DUF86 family)